MKKSLLFALCALLLPIVANAYNFSVDGIYYNKNSDGTSVTVTYKTTSYNSYSGSVVIPSTVTYNDTEYSVTSIGNYAFRDCSGLTSITIPNSVTSIGNQAFNECSTLTSITIPNSVTSIGYQTFYNCSGLTSVTIPNSVTSIGNQAFYKCSTLTSITIPNSMTSIGSEAFYNCSGLTSVTIGNSVTSIGSRAFYYCSGLTSVTIPNSVTSIGERAFEGTAWFNNQPDGLVYAGKVAYEYKGTMPTGTHITLEEGTLGIADYAFRDCSGLTSVTIPNSMTSIGQYAFYRCSGLTSVTIGNSVTSIGESAFYGTAWFNNQPEGLVYAGKVAYKYKGTMPTGTHITLEEGTLGIADYAFSDCSGLTSVTIPNSVTSIGEYAFRDCSGLTSVTIPNSVTSIGERAFTECRGLTSVTIPNSVTSIGERAFSGCSGLTSVTCQAKNVPTTGDECFYNVPQSTATLYVPEESVNAYKFASPWKDFGTISAIVEGEDFSVGGIYYHTNPGINTAYVTYKDTGYNSYSGAVVIPSTVAYGGKTYSVTSIGDYAFRGCSVLTSVTIPNSVTRIGLWAFRGCSGLTSVTLNANDIVSKTYSSSSNLGTIFGTQVKEYVLGDDVTSIGNYAFYNCRTLTSIIIPNSVTSIGYQAFYNCSSLTSVTIPNSVTSIGDNAFSGCSGLTSVTIPNNVTSIGSSAFTGCPLQTIVNRGDNDINKSTFSDRVYLHTQLYVPEGTVWDYIFNTGWGEFHNIREFANNADNIRNNAVYLIADHSGRNFPVYDRATKSLKNVAYTLNLDDNDAGACWRIVKDGSDTYLYNIGAGMYAAYDVENKLSLSIAPSAVDIKVTKEGTMINGKPAMLVVNKSVTPEPTFILGDANGNGEVEIGDVTSVLTLMATPESTGYDNKAADANGNGEIEIGDVTTILTIMAGN